MSITPLPPAPAVTDTTSEFNTKAFNFVAALPTMVSEINAFAPDVEAAAAGSTAVIAAANYKGEWSSLSGALNIPASVSHNNEVWLLTANIANVALKEPGVDPVWDQITFNPETIQVGTIRYFAGATTTTYPGSDWLKCDGSVYTQTAYSELYNRTGLIADGLDAWTSRVSNLGNVNVKLIYGNNLFVAIGHTANQIATSTDAITWTAGSLAVATHIAYALNYVNGLYLYAGETGVLGTSTDAITWTARTSDNTYFISALTYGNGLHVYGGRGPSGGKIATSTDGITWTDRTANTTKYIQSLAYGNGLYIYGAYDGDLATSTNGITWIPRTSGTTFNIGNIIYDGSKFIYTAGDSIGTSTDGITWSIKKIELNPGGGIYFINFAEGLYTIGIYDAYSLSTLRTSTDLITWETRYSGVTSVHSLTYNNGKYVYGGSGGKISTAQKYTYNSLLEFVVPKQKFIEINSNAYIKAI